MPRKYTPLVDIPCQNCGAMFRPDNWARSHGVGRYCSRACMRKAFTIGDAEQRECAICGKGMTVMPFQIRAGRGRYCSRPCTVLGQTLSREPNRTCQQCGKPFWAKSSEIKRGGGKFCEPQCRYDWMKGENHPRWNGGLDRSPHSPVYGAWRTEVFRRDKFTCQQCGQWGGRLEAHHILPWKDHVDVRFDVSNGITLCRRCHIRTHHPNAA